MHVGKEQDHVTINGLTKTRHEPISCEPLHSQSVVEYAHRAINGITNARYEQITSCPPFSGGEMVLNLKPQTCHPKPIS